MPPKIKGWEFETACGKYAIEYLVDPEKDNDRNRWEYWLQFKWIDPHDTQNRATPEFRMHLDLFEEDMLVDNAEVKLYEALRLWIDAVPHCDDRRLSFRADSALLKERCEA